MYPLCIIVGSSGEGRYCLKRTQYRAAPWLRWKTGVFGVWLRRIVLLLHEIVWAAFNKTLTQDSSMGRKVCQRQNLSPKITTSNESSHHHRECQSSQRSTRQMNSPAQDHKIFFILPFGLVPHHNSIMPVASERLISYSECNLTGCQIENTLCICKHLKNIL